LTQHKQDSDGRRHRSFVLRTAWASRYVDGSDSAGLRQRRHFMKGALVDDYDAGLDLQLARSTNVNQDGRAAKVSLCSNCVTIGGEWTLRAHISGIMAQTPLAF
jgi:hypothetical protein